MTDGDTLEYVGEELDIFAHAVRWKSYWSSSIRRWVRGDVLEVGAGLGVNTPLLNNPGVRSIVCLEPDPLLAARLTETIRSISGAHAICGTLASAPKTQFDSIVYIDVLEHIEADGEEMRAAAELLRPNGRLVVLSPAHQFLYSEFDASIGHFRRYRKESLRKLLPGNCRLEALYYLDSVGMLASLANRVMLRQGLPTVAQIKTWDRFLIPVSRVIDPLLGHMLGKTIISVFARIGDEACLHVEDRTHEHSAM